MYEIKTTKNTKDVHSFIEGIENEKRKADALFLLNIFQEVTKEEGVMWGDSIIGFGHTTYSNTTLKDQPWFKVAFSPRKQNLTLYFTYGFADKKEQMEKLGKHKVGKGCLYITRLANINIEILKVIIQEEYNKM